MVEAPDFDRNMLLLATQISHQQEMKGALLLVLEALLKTLKPNNSGETAVEAMTLIRCIIRLALGLIGEPTANKTTLIDTLLNHFRTAKILTEAACAQKAMSLISKDVSWLWRTAYNCAVEGCFSAVSGRVAANGQVNTEQVSAVTAEIVACRKRIASIMEKGKIQKDDEVLRVQYFIHTLQVFEAEFLTRAKSWDRVPQLIEEIVNSGPLVLGTYEAVADVLYDTVNLDILYGCLEYLMLDTMTQALLRASLDHNHLSVGKFSRWLRAICTIILVRNTPEDRFKAIGYVEQALTVIEDSHDTDQSYPMDERQWLLATSYNSGIECLHGGMLDEAKRWFEASTVICRFVPDGQDRAKKVRASVVNVVTLSLRLRVLTTTSALLIYRYPIRTPTSFRAMDPDEGVIYTAFGHGADQTESVCCSRFTTYTIVLAAWRFFSLEFSFSLGSGSLSAGISLSSAAFFVTQACSCSATA
ncbi:hypothetical protein H0H92_006880 [Tricholoma furcatifolium]|nr:hypothetical protein H0H92_006880 [Tricholoma furcatifolium]